MKIYYFIEKYILLSIAAITVFAAMIVVEGYDNLRSHLSNE